MAWQLLLFVLLERASLLVQRLRDWRRSSGMARQPPVAMVPQGHHWMGLGWMALGMLMKLAWRLG